MPVQVYQHGAGTFRKATPSGSVGSQDGVLRWMETYADALTSGMFKVLISGGFRPENVLFSREISPACCLLNGPCRRLFCQTGLRWAHQSGHCGCAQFCGALWLVETQFAASAHSLGTEQAGGVAFGLRYCILSTMVTASPHPFEDCIRAGGAAVGRRGPGAAL